MNLQLVTITGADERTDPAQLRRLSDRFPFVEWGLLLSLSRTGFDNRYPSIKHLRQIAETGVRTSVHLCGALAREAAHGHGYPIETAMGIVRGLSRVQINLGRGIEQFPRIGEVVRHTAVDQSCGIIIQSYRFDTKVITDAAYECGHVAQFLHDASGGRGITGAFQRPTHDNLVGYAGGISPDNVLAKLAEIDALQIVNPVWIDMESGVRTDDWLDLTKVEHVLETCAAYRLGVTS